MGLGDRIRRLFGRMPDQIPGIGQQNAYTNAGYKIAEEAKRVANSPDALLGRLSYTAGPILTRYSTYPGTGLNPATLLSIFQEADLGIMIRKSDLDEQILQRDAHLQGVDRSVRNAIAGKPFRVRAANESDLAVNLAKFMRAVIDQIDSFDRSIYGLLLSHASGYACSEIVYDFGTVRLPDRTLKGIYPRQLDLVHNKHFRFNLITDEPLLDVGQGGLIPLPDHKFVFHTASDNWFAEKSGYMRSVAPLHMLKSHALRDWAVFIALFGLPNIFAQYPRELFQQNEAKAQYEQVLQDFGQGKPALLPDDLNVNVTPAPSGGTSSDVHAAMIGWVNTEISKVVQGETLTTELGGVGSYNASETHADVKHDTVVMLSRALAASVRRDLFTAIVELNLDMLTLEFGATPEEIKASIPFAAWRIEREVNPNDRARIFSILVNELGMSIPVDQPREEFGIDPPQPGADVLKGKPVPISSGGAVAGSVDAADGIDNPKPEASPPPAEPRSLSDNV